MVSLLMSYFIIPKLGISARLANDVLTMENAKVNQSNVLGQPMIPCSMEPLTGFYRNGHCCTGPGDVGLHTVCAVMTESFLEFSRMRGNDLSTPIPAYQFPGLKEGDKWCLCVQRWAEAFQAGMAPKVVLEASHISVLEYVDLEDLKEHEHKDF